MDSRKIQFLIGIQREIDKLEANEGNTPKIEKVKSRFYDVVEVEEMMGNGGIADELFNVTIDELKEVSEKSNYTDRTGFCPHQPKYVAEFLKNFRRVNDSGLRELVHPPYDEDNFDLSETYKKIENEFFPESRDYSKFKRETRLPFYLWVHVRKDLKNLYQEYGLPYWEINKKHPLLGLPKLIEGVHKFIKSIRLGRDTNIETSFREQMMPSILAKIKQEFPDTWVTEEKIQYLPDCRKFDASMVLMTDVIRIQVAVKMLLKLVEQKSNWRGELINTYNLSEKKITLSSSYTRNEKKELITTLTITDNESWCDKQPEYLFNSGDLQGVVQNLWSLCEWEILARFSDGECYRLDMLNSHKKTDKMIEKTNEEVNGFTHVLTFYH